MKQRSLSRNLIFLSIWLAIGAAAAFFLAPTLFTARDAAPNMSAMSSASDVPPLDEAPASHFYTPDSTVAGGAAPSTADTTADTSTGPMLAPPTENTRGDAAPGSSNPDYSQFGIAASPGAAAPPADGEQAESYQPWASNAYGSPAGGAAPDFPSAPAPNEPGASAGDDETPIETTSPGTGAVGDADAIEDPLQPAAPDNYGPIGLSGIGEGGGGSGDGIGLGNIGTLKSGGGSGQTYGYGSGRGGAASHPQMPEIDIDTSAKPPMPPDAIISASDDAASELDRKLAALPLGNIAFNTPEAIPLGQTATIELLASLKEAEAELRQQVHGSGPVDSAHGIQISDQMEAKVTGLGFRIEAITPERQAVSHTQETKWRWQIEPTKSDKLELNLTLSALIKIDGEPSARAIRTFEKTILVNVPLGQRITTAMNNNFELLTTVILIPVAGGTWRYVRKRKRRKTPPPDDAVAPRQAA